MPVIELSDRSGKGGIGVFYVPLLSCVTNASALASPCPYAVLRRRFAQMPMRFRWGSPSDQK
jgi:hypothetical protein